MRCGRRGCRRREQSTRFMSLLLDCVADGDRSANARSFASVGEQACEFCMAGAKPRRAAARFAPQNPQNGRRGDDMTLFRPARSWVIASGDVLITGTRIVSRSCRWNRQRASPLGRCPDWRVHGELPWWPACDREGSKPWGATRVILSRCEADGCLSLTVNNIGGPVVANLGKLGQLGIAILFCPGCARARSR